MVHDQRRPCFLGFRSARLSAPMDDSAITPPATPALTDSSSDRLDSWKQIAAYLGRGVTTVQRWEQDEGLPVHRLPHAKKGSVFAYRRQLDAWQVSRAQLSATTTAIPEPQATTSAHDAAPVRRWSAQRTLFVAAGLAACLIAALLAALSFGRRAGAPSVANGASLLPPQPLANDSANEGSPSLSPDGSHVVYYWALEGADGLYVKPIAGGTPHRLALGSVKSPRLPRWSPRGDLIAFLSQENDGVRGVYIVSTAGGVPRRLTSAAGYGLCWTPGGEAVGFADRNASGEPLSIFQVSIQTGEKDRLTVPPASSFGDTDCSFSSDGKLAVSRFFTTQQADVCVIVTPGALDSAVVRLTYASEGITGLAWTPDDRAVVFGTASGLWRIQASSDTPQPPILIARGGGQPAYPTFSRSPAAHSHRLAYELVIFDVNLWRWDAGGAGTNTLKKLSGSTVWDDDADYSPDGRQLAFVSNRTGTPEIWLAAADGSQARQITFHRGPPAVAPKWSPDGRHVAYTSLVGGNQDVYVARVDGTQASRITWEPSQEENPSWSRDGRWIYFRSDRTGTGRIWKMPSDGSGTPVQVTTGEGSQAFESPDGTVVYFVRPGHVPGLWSIGESGKETLVLPGVEKGFWGIADTGIAYIVTSAVHSRAGPTLRFFDFASGQVSTLTEIPVRSTQLVGGLTVSRDGRSVVWAQTDRADRDLMLIDPWRP